MFRRECFAKIGGFTPVPHGGLDTVAELEARMAGYSVESFPYLKAFHYRRSDAGGKALRSSYNAGCMDFEMGYHPIYELLCCVRRLLLGIPLVSPIVRYAGFACSYLSGRQRAVTRELVGFLQAEQMRIMKDFVRAAVSRGTLKKRLARFLSSKDGHGRWSV